MTNNNQLKQMAKSLYELNKGEMPHKTVYTNCKRAEYSDGTIRLVYYIENEKLKKCEVYGLGKVSELYY